VTAGPSAGAPVTASAPAVPLHGSEVPSDTGGVWTAAARSERPGDHVPAPEGHVNPPALELHGSTTPPEHPVWTGTAGGVSGPYDLGRSETTAPEGHVNPPARELHGPTTPPGA
jgi:hypothetical protein